LDGWFSNRELHFLNQIQIHEETGDVCQVANEPPQRRWKLDDERRCCDDLVFVLYSVMLIDVNFLQIAAAL